MSRWSVWVSFEQLKLAVQVLVTWWFCHPMSTWLYSGDWYPNFEFQNDLFIFSNVLNATFSRLLSPSPLHRLAKSSADVRAGGVQRPIRRAVVLSSAVLSHRASGSSRGRLLGGSAPDKPQFLLLLKLRARPERGAVVCEPGGRLWYQVSEQPL